MTEICGERVGVRTQDLQIKRNSVRGISPFETVGTVANQQGANGQNCVAEMGGLETLLPASGAPEMHPVDGRTIVYVAYKLMGLFESGPGFRSRSHIGDALALAVPIITGSVRLRITRMPLKHLHAVERRKLSDVSGESGHHRTLKEAAVIWMKAQGATDARTEVSCFVGRADAYSEKRGWAVECGDTRVTKLASLIYAPEHRLTLIPYQPLGYAGGSDLSRRRPMAVEFIVGPTAPRDLASYHFSMTDGLVGSADARKRPAGYAPATALAPSLSGRN